MNVTSLSAAPPVPFDLDGRILFKDEVVEIVHLTLKPGQSIARHRMDFCVQFFVIEGSAGFISQHQLTEAGAGTLVEFDRSEERGLSNAGSDILKVLVIKRLQ